MDERISIRGNSKPLRKYGSISNNTNFIRNEHYIKHVVTQSDTLQGLALKYNVTVSIIIVGFGFYVTFVYIDFYLLLHMCQWHFRQSKYETPIDYSQMTVYS